MNRRAVDCREVTGAVEETDTTAPVAPRHVVAARHFSTSRIELGWPDTPERDVAGFNVYRSTNFGATYTKRNPALVKSSSFADSSSPLAIPFYFGTAVDTAGNESMRSDFALAR